MLGVMFCLPGHQSLLFFSSPACWANCPRIQVLGGHTCGVWQRMPVIEQDQLLGLCIDHAVYDALH